MTKSADNKRWAIVPPPSAISSALSGEFQLNATEGRRYPARRIEEGEVVAHTSSALGSGIVESGSRDLRRISDVEEVDEDGLASGARRHSEVQASSIHERPTLRAFPLGLEGEKDASLDPTDASFDTIPAPQWPDSEE